jgi:hypothetical protein
MRRAHRNLVLSLRSIRRIANDVILETPAALGNAAMRERHETILSALIVNLSGFFESFLRDVAEQYLEAVSQQNQPFGNLNPSIRKTHFQGSGIILRYIGGSTRSRRYSWINATASDVVRRLASVNAGTPYELVWEAFAETRGNPGSELIKQFMKRFGVNNPSNALSRHTTRTAATLFTLLDSFIAIRNECAHTGRAIQTPTAVDVLNYCAMVQELSKGLIRTLGAHPVV